MKKITIKDIARIAGTSTTTVSRVINNRKQGVGSDMRERILEIIEETGYKPNLVAKSMITNRSDMIAFLSPDIVHPFYHDIINGINDYARKHHNNVFLFNTGSQAEDQVNLDLLLSKGVDGVILAGFYENMTKELRKSLHDVPLVVLDNLSSEEEIGQVYTDNLQASYELTTYLLNMGHKHIGCIIGPTNFNVVSERLEGYKLALSEYGIPYDDSLVKEGGLTADSAQIPAKQLLENDSVTAIYCFNDLMAYGLYQLCSELGVRIPDDLSVVGFDGIIYSEYLNPPLTTVRQPGYDIGVQSMKHLLEIINDNSIDRKRISLKNELIIRKSVAKI